MVVVRVGTSGKLKFFLIFFFRSAHKTKITILYLERPVGGENFFPFNSKIKFNKNVTVYFIKPREAFIKINRRT